MFDLDYIILQPFRKYIPLPGYFQQILFYYIISVGIGQNLVFGLKQI